VLAINGHEKALELDPSSRDATDALKRLKEKR
jgi:hypothetical protein